MAARRSSCRMPKRVLFFYVTFLTICTFATLIVLGLCYLGPSISTSRRVIETRGIDVDQFYSGVLLSILLSPIGLLIRKTCDEIALRHPFDIAYTQSVKIADLDTISNPGPIALLSLIRYSKWRALVQAILMLAGWLLVPVGTLIVTTGSYIPSTPGRALVAMPTAKGGISTLSALMNLTGFFDDEPSGSSHGDTLTSLVSQVVDGNLLGGQELVDSIPAEIGIRPQVSTTAFVEDVTYQNIVTWTWSAECQDASAEVAYAISTVGDEQVATFTLPDNSTTEIMMNRGVTNQTGANLEWHDPSLPIDSIKYNYYYIATLADTPQTATYPAQLDGVSPAEAPVLDQGVWIARVKCELSLKWRTADCMWDGKYMRNCTAAPPPNNTVLDTTALDALDRYMYITPWEMFGPSGNSIFKWDPWPGFVPSVANVQLTQSLVAFSLVTVACMSSWGTVEISTFGEPMREVYIVRIYILIIIFTMLLLVTTVALADIAHSISHRLPSRKIGFLSIANAVRGMWWDRLLDASSEKPLKTSRAIIGDMKVVLGTLEWDRSKLMLRPSARASADDAASVHVVDVY